MLAIIKNFYLCLLDKKEKRTFIQKKSSDKYFEIAFCLRFNSKLLTKMNTYVSLSWELNQTQNNSMIWSSVNLNQKVNSNQYFSILLK